MISAVYTRGLLSLPDDDYVRLSCHFQGSVDEIIGSEGSTEH